MILELFNFQFTTICYKSDAKIQKNIQTTKYQFFTHKKVASSQHYLTTYDPFIYYLIIASNTILLHSRGVSS